MVKFVLLLILAVVETFLCQVFDYHNCPEVEVVKEFNITAYYGTWYEYSRYWDYFKVGTTCNTISYTSRDNGSIDILETSVDIVQKIVEKRGIANLVGDGSEGRLDFSFPPSTGVIGEYEIIGTDYENWAAVWQCTGIDTVGSIRWIWLWTRQRNPSDEVINATLTSLVKFAIPIDILIYTDQENCTTV